MFLDYWLCCVVFGKIIFFLSWMLMYIEFGFELGICRLLIRRIFKVGGCFGVLFGNWDYVDILRVSF